MYIIGAHHVGILHVYWLICAFPYFFGFLGVCQVLANAWTCRSKTQCQIGCCHCVNHLELFISHSSHLQDDFTSESPTEEHVLFSYNKTDLLTIQIWVFLHKALEGSLTVPTLATFIFIVCLHGSHALIAYSHFEQVFIQLRQPHKKVFILTVLMFFFSLSFFFFFSFASWLISSEPWVHMFIQHNQIIFFSCNEFTSAHAGFLLGRRWECSPETSESSWFSTGKCLVSSQHNACCRHMSKIFWI